MCWPSKKIWIHFEYGRNIRNKKRRRSAINLANPPKFNKKFATTDVAQHGRHERCCWTLVHFSFDFFEINNAEKRGWRNEKWRFTRALIRRRKGSYFVVSHSHSSFKYIRDTKPIEKGVMHSECGGLADCARGLRRYCCCAGCVGREGKKDKIIICVTKY